MTQDISASRVPMFVVHGRIIVCRPQSVVMSSSLLYGWCLLYPCSKQMSRWRPWSSGGGRESMDVREGGKGSVVAMVVVVTRNVASHACQAELERTTKNGT